MFVFLSKLVPVLFFPAGLAALLLLAALLSKNAISRRRLLLSAALLIWIFGNSWVSSALVRSLEWRYLPQEVYPPVDAIVILGGGTMSLEYPRPTVEINGAGDRVLYGGQLFRQGLAPLIVVTGGNLPWSDNISDPAQDMRELLVEMGVPTEAILVEGDSDNTYENAVLTRELLEPLGIDSILLVTSAMHMPRSVPLFEKQGFDVIPAPTDFNV